MIQTLIFGSGVLFVLFWISSQIIKIKKSTKKLENSSEIIENHTPHFFWLDYHKDDLKQYKNCFIALHPKNGVVFSDPDIKSFTDKYNSSLIDHDSLMVLHTSMLKGK